MGLGKKTKQNKTKCYFHTSLTSQLILSVRRWLWVAFPAAFLSKLWRWSQPGPGSPVPTVTGGTAGGRRGGRGKEAPHRTAGAEHSRVGASCPGVPRGSRPTTGTFSRFLEAAPAPAEPCGFPPAAASQPPLPNVLGERSQVRQSGDKSELSLAALGLCSGLIGGSGSPPAPLRAPRAGAPGLAAWAGLAPRGKLPTCFQHEEGACVFELRRNLL